MSSARKWALSASRQLGLPIPNELKPLLVENLDKLYNDPFLGLSRVNGVAELGHARAFFDLYSSHQLIEVSRRPDIAQNDRRAFVGAAWTRAYAQAHWDDVFDWLPDLAGAFPELDHDVHDIQSAWFRGTKQHRATLLLLRNARADLPAILGASSRWT